VIDARNLFTTDEGWNVIAGSSGGGWRDTRYLLLKNKRQGAILSALAKTPTTWTVVASDDDFEVIDAKWKSLTGDREMQRNESPKGKR